MFSAMSYRLGVSYNAHEGTGAWPRASWAPTTTAGEGGLHRDFEPYGRPHHRAGGVSGRFGVDPRLPERRRGHRDQDGPGRQARHRRASARREDRRAKCRRTRMIPEGTDAISPAPHHDIYSIEDLRQLVYSLKEATGYAKARDREDGRRTQRGRHRLRHGSRRARTSSAIDGFRGGTGAAPTRIRDNVGIPIELALAAVDQRLRAGGHPIDRCQSCGLRRLHPQRRRRGARPWRSARTPCSIGIGGAAGHGLPPVPRPARAAAATGASPPSGPIWSSRLDPGGRPPSAW